jgi:hypothetical protein
MLDNPNDPGADRRCERAYRRRATGSPEGTNGPAETDGRALAGLGTRRVRLGGTWTGTGAERALSAKRSTQWNALAGLPDNEPQLQTWAGRPIGARAAHDVACERVQFFPPSKPATGTALVISLPSIRNTRPLDADSRVFNAS